MPNRISNARKHNCCRWFYGPTKSDPARIIGLATFLIGSVIGVVISVLILYWIHINFQWQNLATDIYFGFILVSISLVILCCVGYGLLLKKVTNRCASYTYTACVVFAIMASIKLIISCQTEDIIVDGRNNLVVKNLGKYYSENEEIPQWFHDVQAEQKCCGLSGPKDWREFIYPGDKPAFEDVPESCCLANVVGCNMILMNNDLMDPGVDLSAWIYQQGCRKFVQKHIQNLLNCFTYSFLTYITICITLVAIFWHEVLKYEKIQPRSLSAIMAEADELELELDLFANDDNSIYETYEPVVSNGNLKRPSFTRSNAEPSLDDSENTSPDESVKIYPHYQPQTFPTGILKKDSFYRAELVAPSLRRLGNPSRHTHAVQNPPQLHSGTSHGSFYSNADGLISDED